MTSSQDRKLLYLSRADVTSVTEGRSDLFVGAVSRALALHAEGAFAQPLKPYLRWRPDGHIADRIIAMPAYLGGAQPIAGLKWVGSKHDNPERLGLERASALIILNDPDTHVPVAVLEGGLISSLRTAAVTAVASRHLAAPGFSQLACIGCGPIARAQMVTLLEQFPQVSDVHLFDLRSLETARLADELGGRFPAVECHIAPSAEASVREGEVVVTATVVSEPYLPLDWLRPGCFLANVSLMDVHKEVYLRAHKVVVDDWDQCNREGKLIHQLVQEGRFSREQLHAELGQIVRGDRPGRERPEELIVLNPMGMAVEDVACAQAIRDRSLDAGIGTWLEVA